MSRLTAMLKEILFRLNTGWHWRVRRGRLPRARFLKEWNAGGCRLLAGETGVGEEHRYYWLQSAGIFKSRVFDRYERLKTYLDQVGRDHFCVTATDAAGAVKWQAGKPYAGECAYLSHAAERMMSSGDVDGDGMAELLVLDGGSHLLVLDAQSGVVLREVELPADNFAIVYYIDTGIQPEDFILLLGVSDRGYPPYGYAAPWIIMNHHFDIVSSRGYLGAGHMAVVDDINGDGLPEILIGYQLVNVNGEVLWTVDCLEGVEIDDVEQHLDYADAAWVDGKWMAALAGSDTLYLIDGEGKTLWKKVLPHPQFCLLGKYEGEMRVFVFNQREVMNIYRLDGTEVWSGRLPEYWPLGKPFSNSPERPVHMNEPALRVSGLIDEGTDGVVYLEGGWPYIVDFNGNLVKKIPCPKTARPRKRVIPFSRLNDIGLAYEGAVTDVDADGHEELVLYNRERAWIFEL